MSLALEGAESLFRPVEERTATNAFLARPGVEEGAAVIESTVFRFSGNESIVEAIPE